MTERRPGDEVERAPSPRAKRPPTPGPHAAGEEAILGLQELAGNRAVADLLGAKEPAPATGSAGLRIRDALQGMQPPAQATAQRQWSGMKKWLPEEAELPEAGGLKKWQPPEAALPEAGGLKKWQPPEAALPEAGVAKKWRPPEAELPEELERKW